MIEENEKVLKEIEDRLKDLDKRLINIEMVVEDLKGRGNEKVKGKVA